jgi:hypothetical protein
MVRSEYPKRDLVLDYNGRTFALRAYRDDAIVEGPRWRALIIEARTPLQYDARLTADPASCLAAAVRHVVAAAEAPRAQEAAPPAFVRS